MVYFTVPIYVLFHYLTVWGAFAAAEKWLAGHLEFLAWLTPQALSIVMGLSTLGVLAVVIGLAWWRVRLDIVRPLYRLGAYAARVAAGDLDAKPQGRFARELRELADAIASMVTALKDKIHLANRKTEEADRQAQAALEAAHIAEEATRAARRAKAEGMLQAAETLQDIVGVVTSASTELTHQVELSSRGTKEQSERLGHTAQAMEEMNATVLEVSANAAKAAQTTEEAMHNIFRKSLQRKQCADN